MSEIMTSLIAVLFLVFSVFFAAGYGVTLGYQRICRDIEIYTPDNTNSPIYTKYCKEEAKR